LQSAIADYSRRVDLIEQEAGADVYFRHLDVIRGECAEGDKRIVAGQFVQHNFPNIIVIILKMSM